MPLLALLLGVIFMPASAQLRDHPAKLDDLRDRYRPLLVFAADLRDPQLRAQLQILHDHASDITERDLRPIVLAVHGSDPTQITFAPQEAVALRRRYHILPTAFAVILIGKDGGEKLRSATPLSIETLNHTIDGMPMRQDEMRTRPPR